MRIWDTLANIITGQGTAKSKSSANVYSFVPMQAPELEAAYRGSWLARKVVDIPAMDMCREWRAWQADDAQIEAIEAEEARLGVQAKVLEAKTKARLYGGAAIVIGDGTAEQASELDPARLRRGGIAYLAVLTASRISAGEIETDVQSRWFGTPAYYEITTNTAVRVRIHPSRVVRFVGAPVPDQSSAMVNGWGDSILEAVAKALKDAESTAANIADLTHEAKIDVLKIPDLMLMASNADYEARFQRRTSLAMLSKSLNNTLILDALEEYTQKQVSFSTLPEVLDRFLQIAAGAADIPMTRLLGQSPAGLNSTGEGDLVNYYDRIGAGQKLEIAPAIAHLDECLIWSALGTRPKEIHYRWNPLWQMSEKERAEIGLKKAQAFQIDVNSGLIPDSALSKARVNQLVEDGQYPGLEAAMDEAKAEGDAIDFGAKAEEPTPQAAPPNGQSGEVVE